MQQIFDPSDNIIGDDHIVPISFLANYSLNAPFINSESGRPGDCVGYLVVRSHVCSMKEWVLTDTHF